MKCTVCHCDIAYMHTCTIYRVQEIWILGNDRRWWEASHHLSNCQFDTFRLESTVTIKYQPTHKFVVVNFDALAQASDFRIERRQVVFLCWLQDSNPEGLWNRISNRPNARWQTYWPIEDQAIKRELNSPSLWSARTFSPLDPTSGWHSHLALSIYKFVVNLDALAQASDFQIERRQVVFLCWMQDSNPEGLWNLISSRLNARWQTDWAIEDQAIKLKLDSPSLWSASIQPTRPHCRLAFAPGSGDKHVCCCKFRCSGITSFVELRIWYVPSRVYSQDDISTNTQG